MTIKQTIAEKILAKDSIDLKAVETMQDWDDEATLYLFKDDSVIKWQGTTIEISSKKYWNERAKHYQDKITDDDCDTN